MKFTVLNLLFLSLILLVRQTFGLPIIDDIVKFGHKINNNQAIEQLSLQIVPMAARVKLLQAGESFSLFCICMNLYFIKALHLIFKKLLIFLNVILLNL